MDEVLRALGWETAAPTTGLRLEGVGGLEQHIGRAWSPTGGYRGMPVQGGMYVLLGVEGRADVTYDGTLLDVAPDHLVLLDAEAPIEVTLTAATARYLWKLRPTALAHPGIRARLGEPIPVERDAWQVIAALTNSALSAPAGVASSQYLVHASEQLLAAVIDGTGGIGRPRTMRRPDQVYGEAMQAIELSFRDVDCRPATIATDVCVSERTLRRAFASMGGMPHVEIERRRASELRALVAANGEGLPFALMCEMSGFRSPRQGRLALQRTG